MASACPSEETLTRFDEGSLSEAERAGVVAHVERCEGCRQVVAALTGLRVSRTLSSPVKDVPVVLDRYRVLGEVGRGAVGRVYAAEDSVLGRKVALKVVHDASQVLLRESRAVARLSHRNVITIHDVVLREGWGFLSMEFIDGGNLASWLEVPRSTEAVLKIFVQIADGLAAAHRAGLVHRDMKPANVLITSDGRACVSDFGLASVGGDAVVETLTGAPGTPRRLLGTPAYMAPEQFDGGALTPATDQFGFFIALHEALGGARPFEGTSVESLGLAVREGRRRAPPRAIPSRLLPLLERGLSLDPARRFASMDEVAALLRAQLTPRRSRAPQWVAAAVVLIAVTLGAVLWSKRLSCAPLAGRERVWTAAQRSAVAVALAADPEASQVVLAALDEVARQIDATWLSTCEGARTSTQTARTQLCLADALSQLDIAAQVLASMPGQSANRALPVVRMLPPPADCARIETVSERPPPPSTAPEGSLSREAAALVLEAETLRRTGRYAEALEHVQRAVERAKKAQDRWGVADALRLEARLRNNAGEYDEAERVIRLALDAARGTGDSLLIGRTAFTAAFIECINMMHAAHCGEAQAVLDEMATRRPSDELLAAQAEIRASRASEQGDVDTTISEVERAVQHWGRVPQSAEDRLRSLTTLEAALSTDGFGARALPVAQRLAREGAEFFGPQHPRSLQMEARPCVVLTEMGRLAEARAMKPAIDAHCVQLVGRDSVEFADLLFTEAALCTFEGRPDCVVSSLQASLGTRPVKAALILHGWVLMAMNDRALVEQLRKALAEEFDWQATEPDVSMLFEVETMFDLTPVRDRETRGALVRWMKAAQATRPGKAGLVAAQTQLRAARFALDEGDLRAARQELSLAEPVVLARDQALASMTFCALRAELALRERDLETAVRLSRRGLTVTTPMSRDPMATRLHGTLGRALLATEATRDEGCAELKTSVALGESWPGVELVEEKKALAACQGAQPTSAK
ncbi:MAG: hypothetical protein DI536_02040 [Archangium gephyra]|uniref:Protein kinase domain-containing protein n=1 Tax=Archangium gephyra TaxID=48 RepID=A0A2W5U4W6_9BACT|nr:MAG: hypothetical protein DI536_02040 [Archangium gephyra]